MGSDTLTRAGRFGHPSGQPTAAGKPSWRRAPTTTTAHARPRQARNYVRSLERLGYKVTIQASTTGPGIHHRPRRPAFTAAG